MTFVFRRVAAILDSCSSLMAATGDGRTCQIQHGGSAEQPCYIPVRCAMPVHNAKQWKCHKHPTKNRIELQQTSSHHLNYRSNRGPDLCP